MSSPADTLLAQLDPDRIPTHTAIIMDGNGRWACERGLERREGHRAGVQTVSRIVRAAARCGIRYLTLYTFSTENWRRPRAEVDALMTLLVRSAVEELTTLEENNVRLRTIGDLKGLPDEPREALEGLVESTKSNTGITLVLAYLLTRHGDPLTQTKTGDIAYHHILVALITDHSQPGDHSRDGTSVGDIRQGRQAVRRGDRALRLSHRSATDKESGEEGEEPGRCSI